ncbi:hypothetical protein ACMFMG_003897 [Clarireedia jacksonii]
MSHPTIPPLLLQTLQTQNFPLPSSSFLAPILSPPSSSSSATRPLPPLPALIATTKHRLLSIPLTTPHLLHPSTHSLPPGASDPSVRERRLECDIPVQVLDIVDVGRSKGDLLMELESIRLGERKKGREVVRVVPVADGEDVSAGSVGMGKAGGPYKLLLQDKSGTMIWGFEMERMEGKVGFPPVLGVGGKIMLRKGCGIWRGVVGLSEKGGR